MEELTNSKAVKNAWKKGTVIPAFNIFYLPAIDPIARAIKDTRIFALIEVARLEWIKFEVKGLSAVYKEFQRVAGKESSMGLHLDHIPVIDEDGKKVDALSIIKEALDTGYQSVMVDGSRLPLNENISISKRVVEAARPYNVPVEAELGAVMGHETGPIPPYEELFLSGRGFTSPEEATRFVTETGVDWLSIAAGNIHGAVSGALKEKEKSEARLNIEHIKKIRSVTDVPLVLHGGTRIKKEFIWRGIRAGIAKINIGTAIRKAYERGIDISLKNACESIYKEVVHIIREELKIEGSIDRIRGDS